MNFSLMNWKAAMRHPHDKKVLCAVYAATCGRQALEVYPVDENLLGARDFQPLGYVYLSNERVW